MLERQSLSNRALFKAGSLILSTLFVSVAVVPATGAVQSASKGTSNPKAKVAEVLDLPTGHVGQRYETKILGIKGIDVGDASCLVVPELPAGLELNCAKMTISGRPEDAIADAPVHITVSDTTGDSVTIDFNLTVIEGPDVVRIGGGRPALVTPVAAPAPKAVANHHELVARSTPPERPAPDAPVSAVPRETRSARSGGVEQVTNAASVRRPSVPAPTIAQPAEVAAPAAADEGAEAEVESAKLKLLAPLITSEVSVDATIVSGSATVPLNATDKIKVAVVSDDDFDDVVGKDEGGTADGCLSSEDVQTQSPRFLPLAQTSGSSAVAEINDKGEFNVSLKAPLVEGQRFHVAQILPAGAKMSETERAACKTAVRVAKSPLDWGRIHADFAAGVLISNDSTNSTTGSGTAGSGNFSQAHQFYALNLEKSWSLPGCYIRVFSHRKSVLVDRVLKKNADGTPTTEVLPDKCFDWKTRQLEDAHKWQHLWPGFNTYFQTRLTAIPVTTVSTKSTDGAGDTTEPTANIVSTAQTAKVEVGLYLPFFVTRWEYNNQPNALFIAPLAKVGFDTVTGPSSATIIAPGGAVQSQTFEQVYNYWSYGARIGHMELSRSPSKAPETFSYLDIAIGPYSSLQSFICKPGPTGSTEVAAAGSTCSIYPDVTNAIDSRKRLYRFDIEGLLKIPRTAFYVGLNANIGQRTLGAARLDAGFAAPDDLRFFFGTKFDIAAVLAKYNLGPH